MEIVVSLQRPVLQPRQQGSETFPDHVIFRDPSGREKLGLEWNTKKTGLLSATKTGKQTKMRL